MPARRGHWRGRNARKQIERRPRSIPFFSRKLSNARGRLRFPRMSGGRRHFRRHIGMTMMHNMRRITLGTTAFNGRSEIGQRRQILNSAWSVGHVDRRGHRAFFVVWIVAWTAPYKRRIIHIPFRRPGRIHVRTRIVMLILIHVGAAPRAIGRRRRGVVKSRCRWRIGYLREGPARALRIVRRGLRRSCCMVRRWCLSMRLVHVRKRWG
mmetsp:Transcript_10353/g.21896  ORF Transcript_10353/g.21896 Transcript_10353/m.21896 type:complete len:209 (-) Transcript_10353:1810-2436(-)